MTNRNLSRRNFVKCLGVAGAGSAVAAGRTFAQAPSPAPVVAAPAPAQVPQRVFGKTGVKVSALALGGIFDIVSNQLTLQRALDFGVTYWDTANSYNNGNSEKGIGLYLEKNPDIRKKLFIVTKTGGAPTAQHLDAKLEESLGRMKTDYVDLFFLHGIGSGSALTDDVKTWVEKTRTSGKIRFFGFSSHGNMPDGLQAAAKLGWIDGIMLRYDYRLMATDEMRAAMEAAANAGIGLTAMKTQGGGPIKMDSEADLKLGGHFVKRGFTEQQAKLKALWENPQIASICSQMPNVAILMSNVAASLDKTALTAADHHALHEHAAATKGHYCAGCAAVCDAAVGNRAPVADVLRCLMYHHNYGDTQLARETFAGLPAAARAALPSLDCGDAEGACPQGLPIGRLVREAVELFG